MAQREGGDDQHQTPDASAEQQQADEEQHVIRPDEDVVHARGDEGARHRQQPGSRAGKIGDRRIARAQQPLLAQIAALVDIDEGLVVGGGGKQIGAYRHPGRRRTRQREVDAQGLLVRARRADCGDGRRAPFNRQRVRQYSSDRDAAVHEFRRIVLAVRLSDAHLRRQVAHMDRQPRVNSIGPIVDIERTDRQRMCQYRRCAAQQCQQKEYVAQSQQLAI